MAAPAPILIPHETTSLAARSVFFFLHTCAVYLCAMYFSPRLVALWINTIAPFLHVENATPAGDWYLQRLIVVSIVPALAVGYVNVRRPNSLAPWAWVLPSSIMAYKLLTYDTPASLLGGLHGSAFDYFFGVQSIMPTITDILRGNPLRVLAQMNVTAPFCAGIAYSLGAAAGKRHALHKMFSFRHAMTSETSEPEGRNLS